MKRFGIVASWFAAAAVATLLASQAVALIADSEPAVFPVLDAAPVDTSMPGDVASTTTSAAPPHTSASGASGINPAAGTVTTAVTTPNPPASSVVLSSGTVVTDAGTVSLACTGPDTIAFVGAVPNSGWTVHLDKNENDRVRVEFERSEGEVKVEAHCAGGEIAQQISS